MRARVLEIDVNLAPLMNSLLMICNLNYLLSSGFDPVELFIAMMFIAHT